MNTITLSAEEMNKAVEYYLNSVVLKEPITVEKVESNWNNGSVAGFVVSIAGSKTDGS